MLRLAANYCTFLLNRYVSKLALHSLCKYVQHIITFILHEDG